MNRENLTLEELEDLLVPRKNLIRQYSQDVRMVIQNATDLVLHGGAQRIQQWINTHFRVQVLSEIQIHSLVMDYMRNELDDHEEEPIERLQKLLEQRFNFPMFRVHFFKEPKGPQRGYIEYWARNEEQVRLNAEGTNLHECLQNLNRLAEAHITELSNAT